MKLSPPASSSDLEAAREIARRLNQQRRRDDRSAAPPSATGEIAAQPIRLTPPPLPPLPSRAATAPSRAEPPAPRTPEPARAEPARKAPVLPGPSPEDDLFASVPSFATPSSTPAAFEPAAWDPTEVASDGNLAGDAAAVVEISEPEDDALEALASATATNFAAPAAPDVLEADAGLDVDVDVDVDADAALSAEQMVADDLEQASALDQLTEPEPPSPFDEGLLDEPAVVEEPAGPSWDEIVESCRGIAHANGAMLIDPAGQVFAARGDWPAPGPNAIATKLVTMMEKTLKDAPTRSISAPLGGMHLTAWRVPLQEGLVTVVLVGKAPVRADARPAIDGEIHRGTGA